MSDRRMEHMTWVDIRDAAARNACLILPVGALEQHGPHLPLATDAIAATQVSLDVAQELDAVVAPALVYGCRTRPLSGGGMYFPGTVNLNPATFMLLVEDAVREFIRHGFKRIVVLSAHWENRNFVYEGAYRARQPDDVGEARVMVIESLYGNTILPETLTAIFGDDYPGLAREHAAIIETSVMLHLNPSLVHMEAVVDDAHTRFPWWDVIPAPADFETASGVMWKATQGTAEKGQMIWRDVVTNMTAAIREEMFDR